MASSAACGLSRLDGSPLRFVDALVRGIASLFSVAVVGLGFFWILKDEERQAWHDLIAGTYVVSVPRNWPLRSAPLWHSSPNEATPPRTQFP